MRENLRLADVEAAFVSALKAELLAFGQDIKVLHNFSHIKQGRTDGAVIYYHVASPKKIGYADRKFKDGNHTELQHYQAEIAIKVTADEDEALEYAMAAADIFNSLPFIEKMRKQGVGVQKTSEVITVPMKDETDNFILECNSRIIITFNRAITKLQPKIDAHKLTTQKV